jgi:integrase
VVKGGQKVRKDTKTHQDRWVALDEASVAFIGEHLDAVGTTVATVGAAGVELNIKTLRHYTASQLLAARFDLQNTAARLGHGGGGATTLKHYADPVSEVDRRAASYLAELTGGISQTPERTSASAGRMARQGSGQ